MRQSLSSGSDGDAGQPRFPFLSLPGLCSQAVGGAPEQAAEVSAAWVLLYAAAHLYDAVQDHDPPDPWWEALGDGVAINVATGLLSSAWLVLNRTQGPPQIVRTIREDFSRTVLQMCSGQHLDLARQLLPLERAWAAAEAKSGAFFALACRAGARIGGANQRAIDALAEYGRNLGLMLQIADDLSDLHDLPEPASIPALPVAYCMEIAAPEHRTRLMRTAQRSDPAVGLGSRQLLSESGTALYLQTKLTLHRARAQEALESAHAIPPANYQLADLLTALDPAA